MPVWRPVSSPRSGRSPKGQTPTANNSTACFTPSNRCAAIWRSATSRLSAWPRRRCKWKARPKPSANAWPRWASTIITNGSTTWRAKGRARSPRSSRPISTRAVSAWRTCSTATTSRSPIPSQPNSRPVSTVTPTRYCRRSKSLCLPGMRAWCLRLPAPSRATCRPITRSSASR
ncbi:hypothetical protein D3C78_1163830 [compost metagenome]